MESTTCGVLLDAGTQRTATRGRLGVEIVGDPHYTEGQGIPLSESMRVVVMGGGGGGALQRALLPRQEFDNTGVVVEISWWEGYWGGMGVGWGRGSEGRVGY